ncbi:MAG: NUDIX hydrolase [Alphaproteobacteria bacterium]|nr:NUDIX hydrolase [Alphaproteobacteria bacterium]
MTNASGTKILSRKVEFAGWHKLETIVVAPASLRHEGQSAPLSREVYICGNAAIALLYEPETDRILFNEQFRIGAFMAGEANPCLIECCAGLVDAGETPEQAIRREAVEETGCEILDLEFIGKSYPSPGASDETHMLYCARVGKAEAGHFGLEEEGEEIKTHLVPAAEAIRMLDAGEIVNGATLICMNWFARNHGRLRKKWGKQA